MIVFMHNSESRKLKIAFLFISYNFINSELQDINVQLWEKTTFYFLFCSRIKKLNYMNYEKKLKKINKT